MQTPATNKPTDLRIIKTERAIYDAFMKLIATTEYPQITVAAISREACINRKTFYAHYSSIDELLERIYTLRLRENCAMAIERARSDAPNDLLPEFVNTLLRALEEDYENSLNLMRNIELNRLIDMFMGPFEEIVAEIRERADLPPVENVHRYVVCYVGALIAGYLDWHRTEPKTETLEDVGARISRIIASNAEGLI